MTPSQTFQDHIKELRRRVLWVVLSIGLSGGVAYVLRFRLISLLQHPLQSPLFYTSPTGSFNFVLQLSLVIGLFIALPVMIYQLLRFIEPALPITIKRGTMIRVIGSSFTLASIGIAFGYFYMVPLSLHFFASFSNDLIKPLITANEYLSYMLGNLITFALVFQIPLIVLFINWIRPIKPRRLLHYQRHVIVGAFGLAIILPFTYDPISQFITAVPIIFLYYLSVVVLWVANRRKQPAKIPHYATRPSVLAPSLVPVNAAPPVANEKPRSPLPLRPPRSLDGFIIAPARRTVPVPAQRLAIVDKPPAVNQVLARPKLRRRPLAIDGISVFLPSAS